MTTTSNVFSNVTSRTADSAHKAVDSAASAVAPAIDHIASKAHSTVDRAASAAGALAGKLDATGQELGAVGTRLMSSSSSYVKNNPLTALAIAAAVGFLISRITADR